jgi:hypothetical protein
MGIARCLIAVLLAAAACTPATTGPVGAAQQCAQSGGTWRASVGTCEKSMGGGGY